MQEAPLTVEAPNLSNKRAHHIHILQLLGMFVARKYHPIRHDS